MRCYALEFEVDIRAQYILRSSSHPGVLSKYITMSMTAVLVSSWWMYDMVSVACWAGPGQPDGEFLFARA